MPKTINRDKLFSELDKCSNEEIPQLYQEIKDFFTKKIDAASAEQEEKINKLQDLKSKIN